MKRRKRTKKELIRFFIQYGFHLWVIFLLANIILVYSIIFYTRASNKPNFSLSTQQQLTIQSTDEDAAPEYIEPSPTPKPLGPVISLSFTVPGIGSGGGNMNPLHPVRDLTIFLYQPDVDSSNRNVKPLYRVDTKAVFDDDVLSPTYTAYIAPDIDLGSRVKDGDYQIVFKTNQSFRTLIKEKQGAIEGRVFDLARVIETNENNLIGLQKVILGDISPIEGDNAADIEDYRTFFHCYEGRSKSESCPYPNLADFNDDGVVDSTDYNILLLNYKALADMGIPVPTIALSPTSKEVSQLSLLSTPAEKKAEIKPKPTPTSQGFSISALTGGVLFFVLFTLVIIVLVVLFKTNSKFGSLVKGILFGKISAGPQTLPETSATSQEDPKQAPHDGVINKEYFVKLQGPDETNTGFWVELTGDSGHELGHYTGAEVKDGFAQVKGVIKTEKGRTFLEISEITAEA